MNTKRFTKNDNCFICENCGFEVKPLGYSSRNHCPKCLCSKHVDVMPGDRANTCGGVMEPIKVELDSKKATLSYIDAVNAVKLSVTAPPTKQRSSLII